MAFILKYKNWLFLLLLAALSFKYGYQDSIMLRPQGLHQWRQCDCTSIALNYYQGGMNFFEPSLHIIGYSGNGKTVSEFPVIYYFVALLWKIFGYHEFIFRLVNILFTFTGLYALYRLCLKLFKDVFWAMLIPSVLFTSAFFVFYANNFLTNVPALSMAFVGWYFFERYVSSGLTKYFLRALLFFVFAALLKLSAGLSFGVIFGLYILHLLYPIEVNARPLFKDKKRIGVYLLLAFATIASWLLYVHYYNSSNNAGYFLTGILPIWELDKAAINPILDNIFNLWLGEYLHPSLHLIALLEVIVLAVFFRKLPASLLLILLSFLLGFVAFTLLFFAVLGNHDYYMLDMLIVWVCITIIFTLALKHRLPLVFSNKFVKIACFFGLIFFADDCKSRVRGRYAEDGWMNQHHLQYTKGLEDIEKYNRSKGILQSDKVISIPDPSISISLYLMNQPGWSNYGSDFTKTIEFDRRIKDGAKYLFINDSTILKEERLKPFTNKLIGIHRNIHIYKL